MQSDPVAIHLFIAALAFSVGFYAAARLAARQVRRANLEGFKEAARFYAGRECEREAPPFDVQC